MADYQLAMARKPPGPGSKRWILVLVAILFVLIGGGVVAYRIASERLKGKVTAALGPGSEIAALKLGWSAVEVEGLRLRGPRGWPASHTLRAERVQIVPSLQSLLSDRIQIASISVDNAYLSILRTDGKVHFVPTLLGLPEGKRSSGNSQSISSSRTLSIGKIVLRDGVIELFDATVARPPLKLRLERIDAAISGVEAPSLQERIQFELTGVVKGSSRDGRLKVSGWLKAGGRDSSSRIVLDAVDLVKLQPYLVRTGEARVSRGTLDLDLKSEVRSGKLDGKGKVVLRRLEFESSQGYLETFMGIPRNAVIRFLKNHEDAIEVNLIITGDIRNPSFSLNEAIATRIAASVAELLGVSIKGVAENLEALGRKGLEGAGEAAGAIGSALRGLFGGKQK